MEDRREAVCQVLRDFHMGDEWDAAIEDGIPPELASILGEMLDAYRNADIDWLLEHTDPDHRDHPDRRVARRSRRTGGARASSTPCSTGRSSGRTSR